MYDFANSGYTTVVLTTLYSVYFVSVVGAAADTTGGEATFLWTITIAISNAIVLLTAPVLGAIADQMAMKKILLLASTIGCVVGTASLSLVAPSQLAPAMLLLIFSNVMFGSGENLIAAFLPEISSNENIGRISGFGWGLGYTGGILALVSSLAYISYAETQGIQAQNAIPHTLIIVAVLFGLSATPTFLWLTERAQPRELTEADLRKSIIALFGEFVVGGFRRVKATLTEIHHYPDLFRFLTCLTIYQCGVSTIIVIAAIYAQDIIGLSQKEIIVMIIVVNISAAVGAVLFGVIQDKIGSVRSLAITLGLWILSVFAVYLSDNAQNVIWIASNLIGIAMGASQAAGRALIGLFSPPERAAEFFGFWGLASKLAFIIGPMSYGMINYLADGDHRTALLSTLGFFALGLLVLLSVDESRGKQAANANSSM